MDQGVLHKGFKFHMGGEDWEVLSISPTGIVTAKCVDGEKSAWTMPVEALQEKFAGGEAMAAAEQS